MSLPVLFLVVSIIGALFTANALWPIFRPAVPATLSFFAGWLTSELALHHVVWQVVATIVFVWLGALREWPGQVGLAVSVASWGVLVYTWLRAREVDGVVEAALCAALGPSYAEHLADEHATPLDLDWGRWMLPMARGARSIEVEKNVEFARVGKARLRLDVYGASRGDRAGAALRPTLLFIHGGAWVIGNKDQQGLPICRHMAARGWVCFNANYRLSPRATFPDHLVDVKRAIAWVRENAEAYGADPSFIVIAGGSAGGHLASLAALTACEPGFQPGFEEADTTLQGCVPLYGVYDFTDRHGEWKHRGLIDVVERLVIKRRMHEARTEFERASPVGLVHGEAPPFCVVHGELDSLVPVGEARRFVAALRDAGAAPIAYVEVPGAQHAFEVFPSLRTTLVLDGIARFGAFIHATRAGHRGGSSAPFTDDPAA